MTHEHAGTPPAAPPAALAGALTATGSRRYPSPRKKIPHQARVLALASVKGGPGKSTMVEVLASGLALHGFAVLVVEVEYNTRLTHTLTGVRGREGRGAALPAPAAAALGVPSGDAADTFDLNETTWLLFTRPHLAETMEPVQIGLPDLMQRIPALSKPAVDQVIGQRAWRNPAVLEFVPGTTRLRDLDNRGFLESASSGSIQDFDPVTQLARGLEALRGRYDFIVLDTPPVAGLVQRNALCACDYIIPVVDFDPDSYEDFLRTDTFIASVRAINRSMKLPEPQVLGVVYNKFDADFADNDVLLLKAYTEGHFASPDSDEVVPPLIYYPQLGLVREDRRTIIRGHQQRKPLHVFAPTSPIGNDAYAFVEVTERMLQVNGYIAR